MAQEGCPRIKGFEVSPTQHERNSVNFELKHHINGYIGANGVAEAGTRFYPSFKGSERKLKKRQLQKWYENRAEIADQVALGNGHLYKKPRAGTRRVLPRETEDSISPLKKASKFDEGVRSWDSDATSSPHHRHGGDDFSGRVSYHYDDEHKLGSARPATHAETFRREVQDLIFELGITEVYNADQTAINFDHLSSHTIDNTGPGRYGSAISVRRRLV
ncbi:hypothetical protein PI124_g1682 [Phytophthora idaei]|nr:hypothetical protein PI126_g8480 [Phytophthora idaei]KAG3253732.1 hypothetical protein PI124_g1682 [Phytophthora idaei]